MNSLVDNMFVKVVLFNANIDDAEQDTAFIDMSERHWAGFVGTMENTPAAALLDVIKVVQATTSGGAGKKDVPNLTITNFSNLNVAGDKWFLELDAIGMDQAGLFKFAAVTIGADGDNTDLNQTIVAICKPRYHSEELNMTSAEYLTNRLKRP